MGAVADTLMTPAKGVHILPTEICEYLASHGKESLQF